MFCTLGQYTFCAKEWLSLTALCRKWKKTNLASKPLDDFKANKRKLLMTKS